jgi:hypothetical protein
MAATPKKPASKQSAAGRGKTRRQGFLVLGMHRSGTSSVAGTLVKLGIAAPKTLMAGKDDNPRGHWESVALAAFHDDLLASAGSRWDDWRAFHEGWYDTPVASDFKERAKALLKEEFGRAPAFVLKDPRICRLARFWLDIFSDEGIDAKILLPIRSPLEVAQSHRTRDGMPLRRGLLLWLRHVLEAEAATRGLPRSLFEWDGFLTEWRSAAARFEVELDTRWPALTDTVAVEIEQFLSRDLKHERVRDADLAAYPDLHGWVLTAYDALRALARDPDLKDARATLDGLRERFDDAARLFGGVLAEVELAHAGAASALHAEHAAASQTAARLRQEMESIAAERDAKAAEVQHWAGVAEARRIGEEEARAALGRQIAALSAERDAKVAEVQHWAGVAEARRIGEEEARAALGQQIAALSAERDAKVAEVQHWAGVAEARRIGEEEARAALGQQIAALSAERDAGAEEARRLSELADALRSSGEQTEAELRRHLDEALQSSEARLGQEREQHAAELAALRERADRELAAVTEKAAWEIEQARAIAAIPARSPWMPRTLSRAADIWQDKGVSGLAQAVRRRVARWQVMPGRSEYQAWQEQQAAAAGGADGRAEAEALAFRPLISIVVPVYNTNGDFLRACIESVLEQSYDNWEMILVDDASPDAGVRRILSDYAGRDARIKAVFRTSNGHISRASNDALDQASGEWIALLDHDDTLSPDALLVVLRALNADPALDFIYSDKDMISQDGRLRHSPLLKPEWSPEMLYSVNYLTHFNVIRTSLVREIGGFRPQTDGAQDWDLFLRVTEKTERIAHVGGVLYHWRVHERSTSTGIDAKPYALQAQETTLNDHLKRMGLNATAVPDGETGFRIRWDQAGQGSHCICVVGGNSAFNVATSIGTVVNAPQLSGASVVVLIREAMKDDLARIWREWHQTDLAGIARVVALDAEDVRVGDLAAGRDTVTFVSGDILAVSPECLEDLTGWVRHHPRIGFSAGVVVDERDHVVEAGCILDKSGKAASLFAGDYLYSWGIFGGPLWYRNVVAANPYLIAVKGELAAGLGERRLDGVEAVDALVRDLCVGAYARGLRGLTVPKARGVLAADGRRFEQSNDESLKWSRFFHPGLQPTMPPRLAT